jgi:hypothetical protein
MAPMTWACFWQCGQEVAMKETATTLPRESLSLRCLPSGRVKTKSGAVRGRLAALAEASAAQEARRLRRVDITLLSYYSGRCLRDSTQEEGRDREKGSCGKGGKEAMDGL